MMSSFGFIGRGSVCLSTSTSDFFGSLVVFEVCGEMSSKKLERRDVVEERIVLRAHAGAVPSTSVLSLFRMFVIFFVESCFLTRVVHHRRYQIFFLRPRDPPGSSDKNPSRPTRTPAQEILIVQKMERTTSAPPIRRLCGLISV